MKYEDPLIDEDIHGNVNVSKEKPHITFFKLMAALAVILVIAYFLLSLFVFQIVKFISFDTEKRWFSSLSTAVVKSMVTDDELTRKKSAELQRIADKLIKAHHTQNATSEPDGFAVEVYYSDNDMINAFALPGGKIVVMKGLIDSMPDENALAMVIGHEIGHVKNRDSLNALGRGLLSQIILSVLVGNDLGVTGDGVGFLTNSYSRGNESKADDFGLRLLHESYGNAHGATTFFEYMAKKEKSGFISAFNSTHPMSKNRIRRLQNIISKEHYSVDIDLSTPMPEILR